MEKIPTLFERDENFQVVNRPRAECAWVFEGAGVGTEKLDDHVCVPFDMAAPTVDEVPRDYDRLWDFLAELESRYAPGHLAEGIVFHHPDGRRAKIKRKDFPRNAAVA